MLLNLKGWRLTIASMFFFSFTIFALWATQHLWKPWEIDFNITSLVLLGVVFLFSAQFNQSRFSYLCILWGVYFITLERQLPWSGWVASHLDWTLLSGAFCLFFLSLSKDRGLISLHIFSRLLIVFLCGVISFLWLKGVDYLFAQWFLSYIELNQHIKVDLPLGIVGFTLLLQSVRKAQFLDSALLVTFCLWIAHFQFQLPLAWNILLSILCMYYLVSMVLDSYYLAYRDELTSLPTRRALNNLALSLGRKYTVAMLDIDHFKKFNDTYGHDIGDQVLKLVASKLTQVKSGGKVFRYGGEEFTVVFPRKTSEQSMDTLENLRQSVADYGMVIRQQNRKSKKSRGKQKSSNEKTVHVTISIGLKEREPKTTFEETLKSADEALYRAKKKGRNTVSI